MTLTRFGGGTRAHEISQRGRDLRRAGMAAALAVATLVGLTSQVFAQSPRIEGTYKMFAGLTRFENPRGTMTVSAQTEGAFSIKGDDWTGHGVLNWMSGYYDWTYKDGTTGRTFIMIMPDGKIAGEVRGAAQKSQWDYLAIPEAKAPAANWRGCDSIRDQALPTCALKSTAGEQFSCMNDAGNKWQECLEITKKDLGTLHLVE